MKTVCKKLLTMMLVAVMLVSVIPFQAFAEELGEGDEGLAPQDAVTSIPVTLNITITEADGKTSTASKTWNVDGDITLDEATAKARLSDPQDFTYNGWTTGDGGSLDDGHVIHFDWLTKNHGNGYSLGLKLTRNATPDAGGNQGGNQGGDQGSNTPANVTINFSEGANSITAQEGSEITLPKLSDTATHRFKGWEGYIGQDKITLTAAMNGQTFKAVWEKKPDPTTESTESQPTTYSIKLWKNANEKWTTITGNIGDKIKIDGRPTMSGYTATGEFYSNPEGTGEKIQDGYVITEELAKIGNFYAKWTYDGAGGRSNLKVYVRRYAGDTFKGDNLILTENLLNGTLVLDWLKDNSSTVSAALDKSGYLNNYTWDGKFYDYTSGNPLTSQAVNMDGTQSVVLKLQAKNEANVLLYVHSKVGSAGDIYEMPGYLPGETVNREEVAKVIQKHYTGKDMKLEGLYSDEAWNQLKAGNKNPTKANGIDVPSSGTLRVHVLLTNATNTSGNSGSSSNSNADSGNPKTGDSIYMTMTVMGLSAAALAAAYFVEKKRAVR